MYRFLKYSTSFVRHLCRRFRLTLNFIHDWIPSRFAVFVLLIAVCMMTQCRDISETGEWAGENVPADSLKTWVSRWGETTARQPDSIIRHIDNFLALSEAENKYADLSLAYKARVRYYQSRDNFAETYKNSLRHIDVAKQTGDSLTIIDAIFSMGRLLFMNGSYYESLGYFLQLREMNLAPNQRSTLLYTLGQVYPQIFDDSVNRQLATQYYDLAEAETKKDSFTFHPIKGYILFGRANLCVPSADSDLFGFHPIRPTFADSIRRAAAMLEDALEYPTDGCTVHLALSICYAVLGKMEQAHEHEQKAFESAVATPEKLGVVDYVRAVVRYREKKFDEAIRYAEEGIASAAAKRDFSNTSKNMNVLYHTYKTTGHPARALHYLEQITVLQDSLLKKELQEQAVMYQIKYETYTRDEQLRTEKQVSRNRLMRLWFAGTAAVVLMLFSCFLVILYRQKDAAYWGLYQQIKEQDRLADELKQVTSQYEALEQSIARQTAENTPAGALAEQPADDDSAAQTFDDDIRQRKLVDALREYILDNSHIVMADIDRNRLAVVLSTNRTTLSGAVKAVTGKTLMEYVHFLRLEETRKMLDTHKGLSIDAIAENHGLNSRTFYRLFREHYKISPAEYRKMAKKRKAELTV